MEVGGGIISELNIDWNFLPEILSNGKAEESYASADAVMVAQFLNDAICNLANVDWEYAQKLYVENCCDIFHQDSDVVLMSNSHLASLIHSRNILRAGKDFVNTGPR